MRYCLGNIFGENKSKPVSNFFLNNNVAENKSTSLLKSNGENMLNLKLFFFLAELYN